MPALAAHCQDSFLKIRKACCKTSRKTAQARVGSEDVAAWRAMSQPASAASAHAALGRMPHFLRMVWQTSD
jgi:hypothetical protein